MACDFQTKMLSNCYALVGKVSRCCTVLSQDKG